MAFTICSQLVRILTIIYIIFPNIYLVQSGDQNDWDGPRNSNYLDDLDPGNSDHMEYVFQSGDQNDWDVKGFNASSSGTNNESNPEDAVNILKPLNASDCKKTVNGILGCESFIECMEKILNSKTKRLFRNYDDNGYVWGYIEYTSKNVNTNNFSSPDIFCENIKLDDIKNENFGDYKIEILQLYPNEKQKLCLERLSEHKIKSGMDRKASFQKLYLDYVPSKPTKFTCIYQYFNLARKNVVPKFKNLSVKNWCNQNYSKTK